LLGLAFIALTSSLSVQPPLVAPFDISRELASGRPIFIWGGLTSEALTDRQVGVDLCSTTS
jgi:hypothetical protein